jgi:hypothetical protein
MDRNKPLFISAHAASSIRRASIRRASIRRASIRRASAVGTASNTSTADII